MERGAHVHHATSITPRHVSVGGLVPQLTRGDTRSMLRACHHRSLFAYQTMSSDDELSALDAVVADGRYPTRAAVVRSALRLLLRAERDREIAAEYRRAYSDQPQEEWIGRAGLTSGSALIAALDERRSA
jgi:Arc/MetJ-type ribon-helix-helix transcriptional regulator